VSLRLERIVVLRSLAMVRSMSAGIAAMSCGIAAFTASTVSMMLARAGEQDHQHRRLAVRKTGVAQVLDRILHIGDIGQMDGRTVAIRHHQRL